MKKAFYAFVLFFVLFFFSTKQVNADSNFSTDYNVVYTVSNSANTHVNLEAVLTNLSNNYYASSYSIDVGFTDIKNLIASDSDGPIVPKLTKTSNGSSIQLTFNRQVVGINNKLNFDISFDTSEIAQNLNNTWDINIPGISSQNDFSSFNVVVNYPGFLGKPTYIKPALSENVVRGNQLFFNKQDLGGSGISIAFGNFQVYNFNLVYHLQNKNLFPISTEIALPPTTNYQDISIDNIDPKPANVRVDNDGNWLAQYVISPSKKINVEVLGKVKVYLSPKAENLDSNLMQDYLKQETYWDVNSARIKDLATNLKTPYAIYQYVVKTLNYDFSRVQSSSPRLGSLQALNNPNSAVCLEFTDLFIALSRAAGIPAREIDGYAYTSNTNERPLSLVEDILHAWPEYYDFDKKTWIMVDPTWGNTTGGVDYFNTLDFDHIAFIIKGESSDYPIPAGGYKLSSDKNTKDVSVQIGTSFNQDQPKIQSGIEIQNSLLSGLPIQAFVKVSNTGKVLIPKQEVTVDTKFLKPQNQTAIVQNIPPYGYSLIPIAFDKTPILTNASDTIKITVGNNTTYKNVKILPFFVNKLFLLGGVIFVSTTIIISFITFLLRRISLFRQRE